SSIAPAIYIRGIGTVTTALYQEPAVGIYLDGVYMPRGTGNTFDLPDLQQAEGLRGPQGTWFGRNTTGGAVMLTTRAPTAERVGRASCSYGSDNEKIGSLVVNTGRIMGTRVRAKFTAQFHDRDGWVDTPGRPKSDWGGALSSEAYSLTLQADATDKLK